MSTALFHIEIVTSIQSKKKYVEIESVLSVPGLGNDIMGMQGASFLEEL